jgi:peptide/nickel transport system substrate-binding protein
MRQTDFRQTVGKEEIGAGEVSVRSPKPSRNLEFRQRVPQKNLLKEVIDMKKIGFWVLVLFFGFQATVMAADVTINFSRSFYGTLPLDPHQAGNAGRYDNLNQAYDGLVFANDDGKIIPSLAETWTISKDWKEFNFVLRKGVKFHDGTPLNAEAVKFSFDRIVGIDNHAVAQWRPLAKGGAKVEATGEYSVKFSFPNPYPLFMRELVYACYGVVSPTYVKKYATAQDPWAKERMGYDTCGTGPFKFVSHEPKQKIVFERNSNYWAGEKGKVPGGKVMPRYDRLILSVVQDPTTRRIMFEKGEIDIATDFPVDMVEDLRKVQGVNMVDFPLLWDAWIYINCSKKPFDDVRVRQAISYAIDYDKIIKDIERGVALPLRGIIPKGMMGYNPNRFRYNRDVAKAKALLSEAGYPNGFSMTLIYSPERRNEFEQESVLIQSFLKDIGVDVKIEKMAYTSQLARQVAGNFDLAMTHFMAGTGDPSVVCHSYLPPDVPYGSPQYSFRWRNAKVIELLHKAITIPDSPEREKMYAEVDDMGIKEAAFIPLYQILKSVAIRNNVSGFKYDTLRRAVLWEAVKK